MHTEEKLAEQFREYQKVAKENKNIDLAALMINALNVQDKNRISPKQKRWAYLISIGAPPFGLLFAAKYYFADESDAKQTANVCVILTVLGLLSFWLIAKVIFSGGGASVEQIQQIKPADVFELTR